MFEPDQNCENSQRCWGVTRTFPTSTGGRNKEQAFINTLKYLSQVASRQDQKVKIFLQWQATEGIEAYQTIKASAER